MPMAATSPLSLHDSVEMLLVLTGDSLHAPSDARVDLLEYWRKLRMGGAGVHLSGIAGMRRLHEHRNGEARGEHARSRCCGAGRQRHHRVLRRRRCQGSRYRLLHSTCRMCFLSRTLETPRNSLLPASPPATVWRAWATSRWRSWTSLTTRCRAAGGYLLPPLDGLCEKTRPGVTRSPTPWLHCTTPAPNTVPRHPRGEDRPHDQRHRTRGSWHAESPSSMALGIGYEEYLRFDQLTPGVHGSRSHPRLIVPTGYAPRRKSSASATSSL